MLYSSIKDIQEKFVELYEEDDKQYDTLEILGASFIANADSIFGTPNKQYRLAEVDWYDTQVRNVNKLQDFYGKIPVIWKTHAANNAGDINSNYGWMIYSKENGSQYDFALRELKENPNSRRATMIYQNPFMHTEYRRDGINDFCCTNAVTYYIKEDPNKGTVVNAVVQMRSNDAVFGYMNDVYWQRKVLDRLAIDLSLESGIIIWQAQSLHVYPRHYHLIEEYINQSYDDEPSNIDEDDGSWLASAGMGTDEDYGG